MKWENVGNSTDGGGHFPGTSLLRHVLPIDAALVDQDRVVVLHAWQKTPVGRRDAARLGAFVSARNERGFWTAIPPLKGEGKNSAAAGNFFLFRPFKRKRNLLCSRRILELRFGGSYLGEILLLFKLPCFPTVKFAAAVTQTTSSILNWNSQATKRKFQFTDTPKTPSLPFLLAILECNEA